MVCIESIARTALFADACPDAGLQRRIQRTRTHQTDAQRQGCSLSEILVDSHQSRIQVFQSRSQNKKNRGSVLNEDVYKRQYHSL